jgi:hypothetical protein
VVQEAERNEEARRKGVERRRREVTVSFDIAGRRVVLQHGDEEATQTAGAEERSVVVRRGGLGRQTDSLVWSAQQPHTFAPRAVRGCSTGASAAAAAAAATETIVATATFRATE